MNKALTYYTKPQLKRIKQSPNKIDKSNNKEECGGLENEVGLENNAGSARDLDLSP